MQVVQSSICQHSHFSSEWYARWVTNLGDQPGVSLDRPGSYRKLWEWAAILDGISSRGKMIEGAKGLGFAVGREPLSSIIAARGPSILASDLADGQDWATTNQHAASLEALYMEAEISRSLFDERVSFQNIDMADLSALPTGEFDFLWSSCALEHIRNLQDGLDFVVEAMRCLKPGGVAFHTTEFNVASNDETLIDGNMCIYRRRDIEQLDYMLRRNRCGLEQMDFSVGHHPYDLDYDFAPYMQNGRAHIKLELLGHITTSCLLIAHKGG